MGVRGFQDKLAQRALLSSLKGREERLLRISSRSHVSATEVLNSCLASHVSYISRPEQCEELRQAQIQSGKSLYFSNSLFCSSIFTKLLEIVKSGTLGNKCRLILPLYNDLYHCSIITILFIPLSPLLLLMFLYGDSGFVGRVVSIEANGLELFNRGGHVMRTWKRHKKEVIFVQMLSMLAQVSQTGWTADPFSKRE